MPEHEELRGTTPWGAVGRLAAFRVGLPLFVVAMFFAFYGDCFDNEHCSQGSGLRFLGIVLLTLAVSVPTGSVAHLLVIRMARKRT